MSRRARTERRAGTEGWRAALGLLALALLAGCSADVTAPFPESQALLVGTLTVETSPGVSAQAGDPGQATVEVDFSGRLDPGRDRRGVLRPVESGAFTLLARDIEPVGTEGAGIRLYRASWTEMWDPWETGSGSGEGEGEGSGAVPDVPGWARPLDILPPAVGGLGAVVEGFRFGVCAAERWPDAPSPEVAVAIRVQCDGRFSRPVHVAWRLTVRSPENGAVVLRLEGDRPPPPLIQVPGTWLPEGDLPWELELEITRRYGWSVVDGAYRTNLIVRWRHLWPSAP